MKNIRLHPDSIEEIKQGIDIVEVISDHVVLKKQGKSFTGLCPFHGEKTPSFTVSQAKQVYYCFGCQKGGNVFKFLMEVGKQSFTEVALNLAKDHQIPIKTLEVKQTQEIQREISVREQLYEILAVAGSFYHRMLYQPQGRKALDYLRQTRHLSDQIIQQFQLGYAPSDWESLYRYLVEQKRYPSALVEEVGLIKPRREGNSYYDQFRERLMIPIFDARSRLIGFGGRSLGKAEPKYLNSPETSLFDKGKTLFALDKASESIGKQDQAIVVEGYFDAIALHAHGFSNAVASLGTAFTQDQLKLLLRYTESKQVIFNFDTDTAGIKATQRAIADIEPLVYAGQVQARILSLPKEVKDADELLAKEQGIKRYHHLIDNAPLWIDWQIEQIIEGKDLKQADQFEKVSSAMISLLNRVGTGYKRVYYLEKCATILSVKNSRLIPYYLKTLNAQLSKPFKKKITPPPDEPVDIVKNNEALLLRIYLHYPDCRQAIAEQLIEQDLMFCTNEYRYLWRIILTIQETNIEVINNSQNTLIGILEETLSRDLSSHILESLFYLWDEKIQVDISNPNFQIQQIILRLKIFALEKHKQYYLRQMEKFDQGRDTNGTQSDRFRYCTQESFLVCQQIKELKKKLNLF